MSEPAQPIPVLPFLHVPTLLEASTPRPRHGFFLPVAAAFVLLVLGSAYLTGRSPQWNAAVQLASSVLMVGIVGVMSYLMWSTVRRQRDERRQLEAIEELVQLRRWPQAAALLEFALSRPARTAAGRVQALMFLAVVLARYNRFDDAIAVQGYLLQNVNLDPSTRHALRLGRAMAMLREDHLFDADRAINELRRDVSRAADAVERRARAAQERSADEGNGASRVADEPTARDDADENDPDADRDAIEEPPATMLVPGAAAGEPPVSAGLALIEMYRDVKTGHPSEAIAMFEKTLPALRRQLGHRVADAHALAARAHDFLGDAEQAQRHWERATLLAPPAELTRRYPEVTAVAEKYAPALAPAEAA